MSLTNRARLNCESLEARDNPSGNVQVFVSGGLIQLYGDEASNRVRIEQDQFGDVYAYGLDNTTVNGVEGVYLGRGIPDRVDAVMGGGNDRTEVVGMAIGGDLNIDGGTGNDSSIVFNSSVAGSLRMYGSEGNDENILTYVQTTHLLVDGGPGFDGYHIDNTAVYGLIFMQNNEVMF